MIAGSPIASRRCGPSTRGSSPSTAPASRRPPTVSAGRSWCTIPTGRQPSPCSRSSCGCRAWPATIAGGRRARRSSRRHGGQPREARHDAGAHRLPVALAAGRPAGAAGDLVAVAHHPAAAQAPRVPAHPHPGRHREPREDAGADAVVADADPHGRRRSGDPGAGRAGAQSQQREGTDGLGPGGAGDRQRLVVGDPVGRPQLHDRAADRRGGGPVAAAADRADRQCLACRRLQDRGAGFGPLHRGRRAATAVRSGPCGCRARHRRRARRLAVVETPPGHEALGVVAGVATGGRLDAQVLRAEGAARTGILHAMSARGQRLGEAPFTLGAGETRAIASFDMPLELRNQVTRVEIAGERSAGAVHLLDSRSQWHRVGLISGASREEAQPLLAPLYYIERALQPFAEIAKTEDSNLATGIDSLIKRNVSTLMLADIGTLPHDIKERVEQWVKKGGILVRFAGPRLEKGGDDLLPVPLRLGGRSLGGALSWATPQPLAPFGSDDLFAGLTPPAEVLVQKQVLADPSGLGPEVKVWARLKDGTPLVTAARRGDGQVIFFHVTANSDWSNLPLSGLFVEMLRRIASLGGTSSLGG